LAGALDLSTAFSDLAEAVTPAVVQIEVMMKSQPGMQNQPMPELPQLPEQFRRFFDQSPNPGSDAPMRGGGSGFIVTQDGYIVTNDHVVGDADEIVVKLTDQRTFPAKLVGTDPTTDVAVIKIEAAGLPHLEWGSSSALRVGAWVMAIGNPGFGAGQLESTVTSGIVSAKGRPLQLIGQGLMNDPRYGREKAGYAIENFIQTDAVINPGNSGGPMVDLAGNVVGMNSAIASTDGRYQGYGFAIPSDLVKKVAEDLMEDGVVHRPWLGVQVVAVAPEDAEAFGLPAVTGVLVQAVTQGSPADDAGLEQGDVLVSVNEQPVLSGGDLQEHIAVLEQGDRTRLGFYREGSLRSATVRLGAAPEAAAASERVASPRAGRSGEAGRAIAERIGVTVQPLDQGLASQFGFTSPGGVVISEVDPAGPGASRGLAPGMRVSRVGRTEIESPADVMRALEDVPSGSVVTLVVESPGSQSRIVNVRAR
jgi:serine protease Do